jgi:hypothetical protein
METNFIIPQAIANYLSRQPYADVAPLIQALQQLKPPTVPIDMQAGQKDQ